MSNNNNNNIKHNLKSSISKNENCSCNLLHDSPINFFCGCCEGIKTYTPADIGNPPSLSFIKYRIGTHPMFKQSMLANLSKNKYGQLSKLTTRQDNDLAIAIIDAWATIADVITFYQERIANEAFLRTCTERLSVLELARTIGYELHPGVASDTFLVFTLQENNPNIEKIIIDKETKVQSIPRQGEMPQTFEIIERIEARPHLNDIRPRMKIPQIFDNNTNLIYLLGIDTKLKVDDGILIINRKDKNTCKFFGKVLDVKADSKRKITKINIKIKWSNSDNNNQRSENSVNVDNDELDNDDNNYNNNGHLIKMDKNKDLEDNDFILNSTFAKKIEQPNQSTATHRKDNDEEIKLSELSSLAMKKGTSINNLLNQQILISEERKKNFSIEIFAFRQKASVFGHNAPSFEAVNLIYLNMSGPTRNNSDNSKDDLCDWDDESLKINQKVNIKSKNDENSTDCYSYYDFNEGNKGLLIFLDNIYEKIITKNPLYDVNPNTTTTTNNNNNNNNKSSSSNWVIFDSASEGTLACEIDSIREETLAEYTITGKVTGIKLKELDTYEKTQLEKFRRRKTSVFIQSERLELAEKIDETLVQGNYIDLDLKEKNSIDGLKVGQIVIITGEIVDTNTANNDDDNNGNIVSNSGTEYRKLIQVTNKQIVFDTKLNNKYRRESVKIFANVAKSSHGQTKKEVVGSGNPLLKQQTFILKQKPLTFIKSTTLSGAISTLEVRVNGVLWNEVDYLYSKTSKDRVFVTRNDNQGNTHIIFGDGSRGARPAAGIENITAKYRIGTGESGLLKEDQLTTLIDRPLGVKSVTNPFPTGVAQDPEDTENTKINAPLKVMTINRLVSFSDFEDFARSFAGIGKAKAAEIWDGTRTIIHLSLAAAGSSSLFNEKLDSLSKENLRKSIEKFKDPQIPFTLDSFIKKTFSLHAKIKVNEDLSSSSTDQILSLVKNTLLDNFSFQKREFAQPITFSEVINIIQNINGVTFVDVDEFYVDGDEEKRKSSIDSFASASPMYRLEKFLSCRPAYYNNLLKKIFPAEILIINPEGLELLAIE